MKNDKHVMEIEEDVATEGHPLQRKRKYPDEAVSGGNHKFLTASQIRTLLKGLKSARDGNFSIRLPVEDGLGEIAEVFNEFIEIN